MTDPFEGLPAHMLQSIPHNVEVEVTYPVSRLSTIDGEQKIALDARGLRTKHTVQLERAGRPLTVADRIAGYVPGEADGWRPSIVNPCIPQETIIDVEAEEVWE